ncbi:unnamed protein product [Closterium sp. NIES-65]|nr:unnamed protein product [Closterium sp. NIES-65]
MSKAKSTHLYPPLFLSLSPCLSPHLSLLAPLLPPPLLSFLLPSSLARSSIAAPSIPTNSAAPFPPLILSSPLPIPSPPPRSIPQRSSLYANQLSGPLPDFSLFRNLLQWCKTFPSATFSSNALLLLNSRNTVLYSTRLFPFASSLSPLPFRLFPFASSLSPLPFCLFPFVSSLSSLPFRLFPFVSSLSSLPFCLFPFISSLTWYLQDNHLKLKRPQSPPVRPSRPSTPPHCTPLDPTPPISTPLHASPPHSTHLHPTPPMSTPLHPTPPRSSDLSYNSLSGSIPSNIGTLSWLTSLSVTALRKNRNSGIIPNSTTTLACSLSPPSHRPPLPHIPPTPTSLLNKNPIRGRRLKNPPLLSICGRILRPSIKHSDLSYNQLSGTLPANIGNLQKLVDLYVYPLSLFLRSYDGLLMSCPTGLCTFDAVNTSFHPPFHHHHPTHYRRSYDALLMSCPTKPCTVDAVNMRYLTLCSHPSFHHQHPTPHRRSYDGLLMSCPTGACTVDAVNTTLFCSDCSVFCSSCGATPAQPSSPVPASPPPAPPSSPSPPAPSPSPPSAEGGGGGVDRGGCGGGSGSSGAVAGSGACSGVLVSEEAQGKSSSRSRVVLQDDPSVVGAVKRATVITSDFRWEINEMASKHHPNLVRLLGYCIEVDKAAESTEQILIYEFMDNGDLERPGGWVLPYPMVGGMAVGLGYCIEVDKAAESTEQILIYGYMDNGGLERWIGRGEVRDRMGFSGAREGISCLEAPQYSSMS